MKNTTEKLAVFIWSECCAMQGRIAKVADTFRVAEGRERAYAIDGDDVSDDWFLWGDGSRDELAAQARNQFASAEHHAPGAFGRRCALSVLSWLGEPLDPAANDDDAEDFKGDAY